MLNLFLENWFILIVLSCCIVVGFLWLKKFKSLPREAQIKVIKEMLYSLVLQAEREFRDKTGQAKFAFVIELFYSLCPVDVRKFITEEMIMAWVEEAVERMKAYFKANPAGAGNILNWSQGVQL